MRVTELMIGDWVNVNGINLKVGAIHADEIGVFDPDYKIYWCSDDGLDRVDPIPLTEGILARNGFEKCYDDEAPVEECYFFRLFNKQCGWFDIDAFGLEEELGAEFTYHDININYVHQLQHLLRLCGIEKELTI